MRHMPWQTNAAFAVTDALFRECCDAAGVKPTTRQASKYRRRKGLAHTKRADITRGLERAVGRWMQDEKEKEVRDNGNGG